MTSNSGLSFQALIAHFRDLAAPIAVSREEVVRRNAKLGHVILSVPPAKAAKLARQISEISGRTEMTVRDAANINAAGRKRARKFARAKCRASTNDIRPNGV